MSELTQSQQLSPILLSQATEAVDNSQPHLASQLHHKSFPLFSDNYANDDNQSVEENARPHTDKDDDKSYDPDRDKSDVSASAFDPFDECFQETVSDYPLVERIRHNTRNRPVTEMNRKPVEIVALCETADRRLCHWTRRYGYN
eukprot:scaffold7179_cov72-Cyclotella_meneghiniana.AAC.12